VLVVVFDHWDKNNYKLLGSLDQGFEVMVFVVVPYQCFILINLAKTRLSLIT